MVFDVHFACVAVFNYINEDNIRAIVNQERSWFSFSKTSFEKQCHGGGGGEFLSWSNWLPELGKSPLSDMHGLLPWQIGMC